METKVAARWPRIVGYPAFFLLCFVFFFHLTLPYDLLKERIIEQARLGGHTLTISSLGPWWGFGVRAKRVALVAATPPSTGANAAPAPPDTIIDQVTVRPTLLPPGFKVAAHAFGGDFAAQISGWVAGTKTETGGFTRVDSFSIKNLDFAKAALKPATGLDLEGVLNAEGDLQHLNELAKATGNFKLSGSGLTLLGGEVANYPLPKVVLGTLDLHLKVDAGKATLDKLALLGGDVDATGDGDITLANRFTMSQTKLKLQFKPASAWLSNKNNEIIKTGLNFAGHPDSKGYYTVGLDGMLGNLRPSFK